MEDVVSASAAAVEERLSSEHADAEGAVAVQRLRLAYVAALKKIQHLEMCLANDKKEPYEDPLLCHAMHLKS
jgi:hypothetical protein